MQQASLGTTVNSSRPLSKQTVGLLIAALMAVASAARAQEDGMPAPDVINCSAIEPDSVQISWSAPCDDGSWLFEPDVGCRMWDWHPDPADGLTWSGECRNDALTGWGVVQ